MRGVSGQKGWAGKGLVKGDLQGAGVGLLLVFTGRKRDWMRNLNGKNINCLFCFSSCHPRRSQCKAESLGQPRLSRRSVGMV